MTQGQQALQRRSIRLQAWDYSWPWWYYITICTQDGVNCFGQIHDDKVQLSDEGEIIRAQWAGIPGHFPNAELDDYVIMPNHMHGIVIFNESRRGEVTSPAKDKTSKGDETSPLRNVTLGRVIGYFKYQATKSTNQKMGTPGRQVFQRNYYDHIIRSDADLNRIRTYIANNTLQWAIDEENPNNRTK